MSTTVEKPGAPHEAEVRPGRWIARWDPEDPAFWAACGRSIARRNLAFSIVAEHVGFSVWMLWSIVVVQMTANPVTGAPGASGWALSTSQALWLVAVPSGVGALLRLPYTVAVPLLGGRIWTTLSALLLVVPCLGLAWAVARPGIGYAALLAIAATAGLGGGNFASSMANISFFFPEGEKGWALGLNAAGGNLGVAVVQKLVPVVVVAGGGLALSRAGLLYLPLAVVAGVLAWLFMDNLVEARADLGAIARAVTHADTWVLSVLYIGTFGSFIGYSSAFPTLLKTVMGRPDIALTWGFLGALVGSVARPLGGRISDRLGGTVVTMGSFAVMTLAGIGAWQSALHHSLGFFFASFMVLFIATGVGNGSTYRMIPAVFRRLADEAGGDAATVLEMKRQAAGAIGVISAVGALGGFLVPICYAWSRQSLGSILPALQFYIAVFIVMLAVTWWRYGRRAAIGAVRA